MVTSAFPQDSEVPVFQKSQVSCQALSLQGNLGFYLVFYQVYYLVFYLVYYQVFSQVPNPRFLGFSMVPNGFP